MVFLQFALFTLLGVAFVATTWRSLHTGRLPCGPKSVFFDHIVRRDKSAAAYWLIFVCYNAFGAWLVLHGLRILFGVIEPVPLT
jgi:hypothetical protein